MSALVRWTPARRAWIASGALAAMVVVTTARGEPVAARLADATCADGGQGATRVYPRRDAVLGPLVLIGGRSEGVRHRADAFNRHGYKIPATLPEGVTATMSVPARLRGRVGFVFSLGTQDRVWARGVAAADTAVRFSACEPDGGAAGRTGWAGGIVVDRPRCATLVVTVAGAAPVRRRVPLGLRC